jgi:hypothetical protein
MPGVVESHTALSLSDVTSTPTKEEGVLVVIFFSMLVWHSRMS